MEKGPVWNSVAQHSIPYVVLSNSPVWWYIKNSDHNENMHRYSVWNGTPPSTSGEPPLWCSWNFLGPQALSRMATIRSDVPCQSPWVLFLNSTKWFYCLQLISFLLHNVYNVCSECLSLVCPKGSHWRPLGVRIATRFKWSTRHTVGS